ncbi:MAG: beta-galactosidase [Phycisphaerae bacterium]
MYPRFLPLFLAGILLACPPLALCAGWNTREFDLTKRDAQAYSAENIPEAAFTAKGLQIAVKPNATYQFLSKETYSDLFTFQVYFDTAEQSKAGSLELEAIAENEETKDRIVCRYTITGAGQKSCRYTSYVKGKEARAGTADIDITYETASGKHTGAVDGLRIYKGEQALFATVRLKWQFQTYWPDTDEFKTETISTWRRMHGGEVLAKTADAYKVGLVLRSVDGAAGTVHISSAGIAGSTVAPDPMNRTFLFDFGPRDQQLADGFCPVNVHTLYNPQRGFGWVFDDPKRVVTDLREIKPATDDEIEAAGLRSPREIYEDLARREKIVKTTKASMEEYKKALTQKVEATRVNMAMYLRHAMLFSSHNTGNTSIESLNKSLDLDTPLERDGVYVLMAGGMIPWTDRGGVFARRGPPFPSGVDWYAPETRETTSNLYDDDDAAVEFHANVPNGRYNLIIGSNYEYSWHTWATACVAVQGRLRNKEMGQKGQRTIIRDVEVQDGTLAVRFFCNPRTAANVKWDVDYLLVLPAQDKELVNQWEWKLIRERGIRVRQVAFAEGDPQALRNEGGFYTRNGKPFFFQSIYFVNPYMKEYQYYCQVNSLLGGDGLIGKSQYFLKPDWEKFSLMDDYPWKLINTLNLWYQRGILHYLELPKSLTVAPRQVQGEATTAVDAKGRVPRYDVKMPVNSALGKEVVKETYTITGNQIKMHPAFAGYYLYMEEWDIGEKRFDDQSRVQYISWLEAKYKTIAALNEDWNRNYNSFGDIPLPDEAYEKGKPNWRSTPENIMFSKFAQWGGSQMVKEACDVIHKNEPYHIAAGGTCEFPVSFCHNVMYEDTTPFPPPQTIRHFGHAPHHGYIWPSFDCEHAYSEGRTDLKQPLKPKPLLAPDYRKDYLNAMTKILVGDKWGDIPEWYEDGSRHFFHPTVLLKELGPEHAITYWTGELLSYKSEAYEGPPVYIERKALLATRAFQWYYRLAPLWIPAQPPRHEIIAPVTETTLILSGSPTTVNKEVPGVSELLRPQYLVPDLVAMAGVKDLSPYKVVMLSDSDCVAKYVDRTEVQKLKDYVRKGGRLALVGGAFFDDPRVDRDIHLPDSFGLPSPGLAQADAGKDAGGVQKLGPGLYLNKDGNVALATTPSDPATQEGFGKLLKSWNVQTILGVAGLADPSADISAGRLTGDGYVLAGACNINEKTPKTFKLQVPGLAPGEYAVIDVTGQRPELTKKEDGGWALKEEPSQQAVKIDYRMTAKDLSENGIPCDIQPEQAQMFLLRPMDDKVWVSIWKPSLKWFIKKPVTVVYGSDPGEKTGASAIQSALAKSGVQAAVVDANEIKLKKIHFDVRVDPMRGVLNALTNRMPWRKGEYEEQFKKKYGWGGQKYLVDTFDNQIVDTDQQLVVVGNAATNVLTRHFNRQGSYAYDKVLDKITASYPDPGRGIIGMVESINCPHYDVTSKSRDAITVGGSDPAGTAEAVKDFVGLLAKYTK